MSGGVLAALRVVLGLDTGPFQRGATQAQIEAARMVKSIEATGKKMVTIGAGMSAAITAPFVGLISSSIPAARESAEAMGQVNASLASMGPVAQRTAAQLQEQAAALMRISTFDDDEILRSVTANMLTFGNISGEAFDRAQLAAVNLATKLKTDLQSATLLVGKALNDPVKGMAAMGRAGIQFTADQKEMIKSLVETGQSAKAQEIILKELEKQFGGSAKAMRDATPGQDLRNSWDTLKEKIGDLALKILPKLLPPIERLVDSFNNLSPNTQTAIVGFVAVAAALGPIIATVGGVVTAFATLGPPVIAAGGAFLTFASGVVTAVIPAIGSLLVALAPILIPLAAVAAAVGAAYLVWKNWDKIKPILDQTWQAISGWWTSNVQPILDAVGKKVMAVVDIFRDYFGAQLKNIVQGVKALFQGDFAGAFNALKGIVTTPIKAVLAIIDTLVPGAVDTIKRLATSFASGLGDLAERMLGYGKNIVQGIVKGILAAPDAVWNALKSVVLRGVENVRQFLGIASPSRLFMEIGGFVTDGLALGIESGRDTVMTALGGMTNSVTASIEDMKNAAHEHTAQMIEDFAQMANGIIGSLDQTVRAIKHGDFIGALQGVLDIVMKVIEAIRAAKKGGDSGSGGTASALAAGLNLIGSISGARALGGPVSGGRSYLVGERGPELFRPGRSGMIIPNDALAARGGTTVVNNYYGPGADEFWGRINQGHDDAARRGATGGAQMALGQLGRSRQRAMG